MEETSYFVSVIRVFSSGVSACFRKERYRTASLKYAEGFGRRLPWTFIWIVSDAYIGAAIFFVPAAPGPSLWLDTTARNASLLALALVWLYYCRQKRTVREAQTAIEETDWN